MRILLVALFLVFAAGATWFALTSGGDDAVEQEGATALAPRSGLRRDGATQPAAEKRPTVQPDALVAKATSRVQEPTPQPTSSARTLDGTVTDRFGAPLGSERVWLLPAGAGHPPEGVELTDFVTARTSRSGGFSLSLPNEGPWSLGVGEPGAPRVPPSTPRKMTGATHADVFVPGSAGLSVSFETLPEGSVNLELMTLRPPGETGRGNFGTGRGNRGGGAGRGNRGGGTDGGGAGGADGGGRRRGGGGGGGQALLAPSPDARVDLAALAQDAGQEQGGQEQGGQEGGRRRGGFRGPGDTNPGATQDAPGTRPEGRRGGDNDGAADELPTGPPEEVWRTTRRIAVTAEERAAGKVLFDGVPVGWVGRIDLIVERVRYEGAQRFGLQMDAITEVKLMPFEPKEGAALMYSAVARPLRVAESPPGVHFRE